MVEFINVSAALTDRALPTVTMWNRLEGRPRRADFDRALRAEVRDALWMLARQWQLGEFLGDDAGSPIFAKVRMATTRFTKYQAGTGDARPFSTDLPLEAQVEARPIPFTLGGRAVALDLRLLLGRQWLKLLRAAVAGFDADFVTGYPVRQPDPDGSADADIVAHPQTWQQFAAVAGRMVDGYALYRYLVDDPTHHAHDGTSIPATDFAAVDAVAARFLAWAQALFLQPDGAPPEGGSAEGGSSDAWQPARLEYRFACSAPTPAGERVYTATEYHHGRLDWYSLDHDAEAAGLEIPGDPTLPDPTAVTTRSFIPVELTFNGMPNTRWWTFEDGRTNFGDVRPDTTDLAKLLLLEFGLVYANDWALIPHALPAGSVATISGMAVATVFGERFWIEPAGSGPHDVWQRWSMFTTAPAGVSAGGGPGGSRGSAGVELVLVPTVPKVQEAAPLEEVRFIRDEMANMVWGIETRVPLPTGESRPGEEAARETLALHRRLLRQAIEAGTVVPPTVEPNAPIRYQVMSSVPENWIPFVPVHVPGDNRQIQLQRGAMVRILAGDPDPAGTRVRPRTALLREGLDRAEPAPYFVHEEEVPRTGATVSQSFQRTRWYGGQVVTWLGARKHAAARSRRSGLRFDTVEPTSRATPPEPDH